MNFVNFFSTKSSNSTTPYPPGSGNPPWQGPTGVDWPPVSPGQDQMYVKILETLRLATFTGAEPFPASYLDKLARRLRSEFQKEIDAWKGLMGADRAAGDTKRESDIDKDMRTYFEAVKRKP